MRSNVPGILLAVAIAASGSATAHGHGEDPHAVPAPTGSATAPAQRYATDAPLRRHMDQIRTAVAALDHAAHGHLDAGQVATLAGSIRARVRDIIAECTLPPEADAALHGIIAPLMQHAGALEAAPDDTSAIAPMREAVAEYEGLFDHETMP